MKSFEKNIKLKKDDIIEVLFYDNKIDYVKIENDNVNKLKVTDEKKTIKRIRVIRPLGEHLNELIFDSDDEIKENKTMELKDIILNKNDVVYFEDGERMIISGFSGSKANDINGKITKIERPIKYETIYEEPQEILTQEEKEWLENFLTPFKDRVLDITKYKCAGRKTEYEYICIDFIGDNCTDITELPSFNANTMYKGMELDKEYTLEELRLFKE